MSKEFFPQPGYAYKSSMRHPANPETVILSRSDCDECSHVGFANIDGAQCAAFRVSIDGKRRYVFQTVNHCIAH
jgi:hypothetical protein